jgi:hypothetical protein
MIEKQEEVIVWIPVSERLPDEVIEYPYKEFPKQQIIRVQTVLATIDREWRNVDFVEFNRGRFFNSYEGELNVIAWAELPKGYQPKD